MSIFPGFSKQTSQWLTHPRKLAGVLALPLLCAVLCALFWALTVHKLDVKRSEEISRAQNKVAFLASDYASFLTRSLQKADQFLLLIRFEESRGPLNLIEAAKVGVFQDEQNINVFVLDKSGFVKDASFPVPPGNYSYRDYYQFHLHHPEDGLLLGTPRIGIKAGGMGPVVVQLTRRIAEADGSFGGVAGMSLRLSYFDPPGSASVQQSGDFAAVMGRDGVLRAARLGGQNLNPLQSGFASAPAFSGVAGVGMLQDTQWIPDHQRRVYAWKALDGLPLVAVVGFAEQNYLSDYARFASEQIEYARLVSLLLLVVAVIGTALVIQTLLRREREELSRTAYRIATDGGKDGFYMFYPIYDRNDNLIDVKLQDCNAKGAAMMGAQRQSLLGLRWSQFWPGGALADIMEIYQEAERREFFESVSELPRGTPFLEEIRWIRRRIVRTGELFAVAIADVTDEVNLREGLVRLANHDLLTSLRNRNWLINTLPDLLERARVDGSQLAVLFIDFDRFKRINDSMGHAVGDELLKSAAQRMTDSIGEADEAAHLSSDQFVIILQHVDHEDQVRAAVERLQAAISQPFSLSRGMFNLSASIGISMFPRDGADSDTLMREADAAMYDSKANGRGQYRFFDARLYDLIKFRVATERALEEGLAREELLLNYQPRVSATTGQLLGFEALVRWNSAERGLVSPGEFIPLAEESGLIIPIGNWVIDRACRQLDIWRNKFDAIVPVSVNVSAQQFAHSDVRAIVAAALERYRLPAHLIELEITESSMLGQDPRVYQDLAAIRDLGVKILVDDFGTGYSSLSQLQSLELDVLKIDRSFIAGLDYLGESEIIVAAIISMAHALEMTVVAEGVEEIEQLRILQRLGCDEIQGYLFARPMVAEQVETFLEDPWCFAAKTAQSLITDSAAQA